MLAYAEGIQENYHNFTIIYQILKLNKLKHVVAADLKLLNILMGLSGHGGKYACIYCEGEIGLEAGRLLTFGSIIQHNQNYVAAGCPINKMQIYKNCVNLPMLNVDENCFVGEELPSPELHLTVLQ